MHCAGRRASGNRITPIRMRERVILGTEPFRNYPKTLSCLIVRSKINGPIRPPGMGDSITITKFNVRATREAPQIVCTLCFRIFSTLDMSAPGGSILVFKAALRYRYQLRNTSTLNSINYAATSNIGQICRIRRIPNSCRILSLHP